MIRRYRQWRAIRRLHKLVERRRNSFEIVDYRKRREAAKLGIARKASC